MNEQVNAKRRLLKLQNWRAGGAVGGVETARGEKKIQKGEQ